jgi:ethanolamine utilization protein EutP
MVVGPVQSGKSTLLRALALMDGAVRKTQNIIYSAHAIDTPGEMMHIPYLYNAFILNSSRAALVLFLANARRPLRLPPKIAIALKAPVYGVVSQIDAANEDFIRRAELSLEVAGLRRIFRVSSVTGEGLAELKEALESSVRKN